jgi:acyl-CoA synthetase (AMP-forming)/AMP-acid ligase II
VPDEEAPERARSLVELLPRRAAQDPDRVLYRFLADGEEETSTLTLGQLDRSARRIGGYLQERMVPGERALLVFPPGLDFITAFLGCLFAGVVAVPVYPPRRGGAGAPFASILAQADPRVVLTVAALRSRIGQLVAPDARPAPLAPVAVEGLDDGWADAWREPDVGASTLAFLQYTSGSTSTPKGVRVSHGNLLHNEEMIRRAFQQSADSVVVSWLPPYHDMGLIGGLLQPLYVGSRCILMSPMSFLQRPGRWLRAISRYRATTSGGPNFAYDLCVDRVGEADREGLDLTSWRVAFNGAEPVRWETLERFSRAFAAAGFRRRSFFPCYGLAEATLFVSGAGVDREPQALTLSDAELGRSRVAEATPGEPARSLVSCGQAWMEQEVAVVDPETGERLPASGVGEIWIRGPSVAGGYWEAAEETALAFAAVALGRDGSRRGGYLRTGDLGFLHRGRLFVTGRLKDLIILRGRNYYPQDLEHAAAAACPGVRRGCVAAFSIEADGEERLVLALEVTRELAGGGDPRRLAALADAVRGAVSEECEVAPYRILLLQPGSLPRTSSGKLRRHAVRARFSGREPAADLGDLGVLAVSPPARRDAGGEPPRTANRIDRQALLTLPADERRPLAKVGLRVEIARRLGIAAGEIAAAAPLVSLGLDDRSARDLARLVEEAYAMPLSPADLLGGMSLEELAARVADAAAAEVGKDPAAPGAGAPSP